MLLCWSVPWIGVVLCLPILRPHRSHPQDGFIAGRKWATSLTVLRGLGAFLSCLEHLGTDVWFSHNIFHLLKWNDDRNWGILMMSWWRRHQDEISWWNPRPSNAHVSCCDGCSYSCFHLCQRLLRTVLSAHSLQHLRHLLQTHMRDTVMHASHEQPTQQLGHTNRRAFPEQKRHRSGPGTGRFSLGGWPRIGRIVRDEASLRMWYKSSLEILNGCYHVPCFHPGCRMGAQKNSVQHRTTPGRNACRSLRGVVFAVSTGGISQTNMWRFPKSWGYPKSSQSLDNFSLA